MTLERHSERLSDYRVARCPMIGIWKKLPSYMNAAYAYEELTLGYGTPTKKIGFPHPVIRWEGR